VKEKLLEATRAHARAVADIQKRVGRYSGAQVHQESLLEAVQAVATTWFDSIRPLLETASFSPVIIAHGSEIFEKLLRQAKRKSSKGVLLSQIAESGSVYKDIIHNIEITSFASAGTLSITPYIEGLTSDEGEYLDEAQRCLSVNALRACVVLGWCATIARIHKKIEEIGFDKFSQVTVEMAGKTTGRFKFFTKKQSIQSRSELQTVFDTDLLWVLEYLQLIDNNQHQRLRHCFEFRNNSAHPGLAPIKGPNLYSFYSDISEIILKNERFALTGKTV
jgi:hypothetical protein